MPLADASTFFAAVANANKQSPSGAASPVPHKSIFGGGKADTAAFNTDKDDKWQVVHRPAASEAPANFDRTTPSATASKQHRSTGTKSAKSNADAALTPSSQIPEAKSKVSHSDRPKHGPAGSPTWAFPNEAKFAIKSLRPQVDGFRRGDLETLSDSGAALGGRCARGSDMTMLSNFFTLEASVQNECSQMRNELKAMKELVRRMRASKVPAAKALSKPPFPAFDENSKKSEKAAAAKTSSLWQPLAVRKMKPYQPRTLQQAPLDLNEMQAFSENFLTAALGGTEWSDGVYLVPLRSSPLFKGQTYYMLDSAVEPFIPSKPATHGAKLTLFFNDFERPEIQLHDVPLFASVKTGGGREAGYVYMGHYAQSRYSDKLDFERMEEVVPTAVKEAWARKCVAADRPKWLAQQLMEAFTPKPAYLGKMPKYHEAIGAGEVEQDVKGFIEDLTFWRDDAKKRLGELAEGDIMEAFAKEDAAEEPGLRFWWEYLECVGFDRNFYHSLATAQEERSSLGLGLL